MGAIVIGQIKTEKKRMKGIDEIGNEKRQYLLDLLENTTYDDRQKQHYSYLIGELVYMHQYEWMLNRIRMNEIRDADRIPYGMNFNQSDIKKHLKQKS